MAAVVGADATVDRTHDTLVSDVRQRLAALNATRPSLVVIGSDVMPLMGRFWWIRSRLHTLMLRASGRYWGDC